jgi:hypothetical protein
MKENYELRIHGQLQEIERKQEALEKARA